VLAIEKVLDDPVGALSAHGLAGIWGTLACGLFTSERLATLNGVGSPGLFQGGGLEQLGDQALGVVVAFACVFAVSYIVFGLIKATIGLRVSAEQEEAGLDIVEHGMYGYPEQFIPSPDGTAPLRPGTPASVTAMSATAPIPAASET
jgi:ammonium transporter, Amt family